MNQSSNRNWTKHFDRKVYQFDSLSQSYFWIISVIVIEILLLLTLMFY